MQMKSPTAVTISALPEVQRVIVLIEKIAQVPTGDFPSPVIAGREHVHLAPVVGSVHLQAFVDGGQAFFGNQYEADYGKRQSGFFQIFPCSAYDRANGIEAVRVNQILPAPQPFAVAESLHDGRLQRA